jgi:hypothetical protein
MKRTQLLMLLAFACGGCAPAKEASRPTVSLRLRGGPPDAMVIVDDEPLGSLEFVAAHGVALPPGVHFVTVKAPGYFPWDREVDAKPGSPAVALEVALTPLPD